MPHHRDKESSHLFSIQYFPKLILNNSFVPTIGKNMPFKYLGRYFNFHMDNSDHMSILLDTSKDLMLKIDCLPCHPKIKLFFTIVFCYRNFHGGTLQEMG